jgi:serine/threonine protein kinase
MSAISKEDFKNDFTYLKLIGEGKCAQVHLVEDKNTGQKFAHKIIKISDVY